MDELQKALDVEETTVRLNMDNMVITILGKGCCAWTDDIPEYEWTIGTSIDKEDNNDLVIYYIHAWDRVVKWLDNNITGGYEAALKEYNKKYKYKTKNKNTDRGFKDAQFNKRDESKKNA